MTITLDLKPEVQAELARQAAANGRAIEAHAATLLEEAIHFPAAAFDKERARAAALASASYARESRSEAFRSGN